MEITSNRDDKGFRKLLVWQRTHELVLSLYKMTEKFPKSEMFALTSQLRRAVVSIPANIAEGQAQGQKLNLPAIWILLKARYPKLSITLYFQKT